MSLATQAQSLEETLSRLIEQSDKLIVKFQNLLALEEYNADRLFLLEDIANVNASQTYASGSIVLTNRLEQPGIIIAALCSLQAIAGVTATLTIDRFSIPVQSIQTRPLILTPLAHLIGPGKKVVLTWAGATDNVAPYFAVYGYRVGPHLG